METCAEGRRGGGGQRKGGCGAEGVGSWLIFRFDPRCSGPGSSLDTGGRGFDSGWCVAPEPLEGGEVVAEVVVKVVAEVVVRSW